MDLNDELFQRAQISIPGGVNSPVRAFRSVGAYGISSLLVGHYQDEMRMFLCV